MKSKNKMKANWNLIKKVYGKLEKIDHGPNRAIISNEDAVNEFNSCIA